MKQRPIRITQKPQRYGDWDDGNSEEIRKEIRKRAQEKLWEVDDIIEQNGDQILVRWSNWDGQPTWVSLNENPEIQNFLGRNSGNPNSCTWHRRLLEAAEKHHPFPDEILLLRQSIFDCLGEARRTDPKAGCRRRVTVKVPFPKAAFDGHFRESALPIPGGDGNVSCQITGEGLTDILGPGWDRRQFPTSTDTFVSQREYIHLTWGYKVRKQFIHDECLRCQWKGEESNRPSTCNPQSYPVLGPPWLALTFTVGRRNRVTVQIMKKRKDQR